MFTYASWINKDNICGADFAVITSNFQIILVGHCSLVADSSLEAELKALKVGISYARDRWIRIDNIFTNCATVGQALNLICSDNMWRHTNQLKSIKHLIGEVGNPKVEVILRDWNMLAHILARKDTLSPKISLYHEGLDLLRWIMKEIEDHGLHF